MLTTLRQFFYYEMLLLLRRKEEWLYPLAFFLIVITLLPFAFSPDPEILRTLIPGGIWIAALFACMLSMQTIFQAEKEEGSLQQWLFCQVPLAAMVTVKIAAQWFCTMLPLICLTPLIGYLLQLSAYEIYVLTLSLLLGTPVLTLLGSLGAALTSGFRQQGVMLCLLILPLAAPILIFGVNLVLQAAAGFSPAGPLALLAAILILSLLGIPLAAAEALRIGEDD
jgi:heme exporter protein B